MEKQQLCIMVCDDDEDTCDLIQIIGQRKGYNIVKCMSYSEFDLKMQNSTPHAIFMDINWGDTNGIEVMIRVRKENDIVVMALSGAHDISTRANEAGIDGYIEKPFALKHIEQVMDTIAAKI